MAAARHKRQRVRTCRVCHSAATVSPTCDWSTHALVALLSVMSPPSRAHPLLAPHSLSTTSTRPNRACASKLKTSRIMRTSGIGVELRALAPAAVPVSCDEGPAPLPGAVDAAAVAEAEAAERVPSALVPATAVPLAARALLGGVAGRKHGDARSQATPILQCEYVRWVGSRSSTMCLACGTHLRIQPGASSGELNVVGDASNARAASAVTAASKFDAYHPPVRWRYLGSVR